VIGIGLSADSELSKQVHLLNQLAKSGQIACYQVIPRKRLFSGEQIDAFLRRRATGGDAGASGNPDGGGVS